MALVPAPDHGEVIEPAAAPSTALPFPPLKRRHVMNCSVHSWHPRYRTITPKTRLIPLSDAFIDYLEADGIILPPEHDSATNDRNTEWSDNDSGIYSATEDAASNASDDEEDEDPSAQWRDVHQTIRATIAELDGKVVPKLNWSAPKDATWMVAGNSMECRTPNDIYLLLKSSDFITHDLEQAFYGCEDDDDGKDEDKITSIPYHLVLRKYVLMHVSLEFRCFVRNRRLIAICQRDLNHYDFLFKDNMQDRLRAAIQRFFADKLKTTFPDDNFAFDVYVPPPHNRVWLIDVNPWAVRTDPLLFSWLELLTLPEPPDPSPAGHEQDTPDERAADADEALSDSEVEELGFVPEFRVVRHDDPEGYAFNTPKYSAHKLPKDVVDMSLSGAGGLRDSLKEWKDMLDKKGDMIQSGSDDEG